MKTTLLTCVIGITSILTYQEPLSKVATIKAPANAQRTSKDYINLYDKENFKNFRTNSLRNIYKIGGVIIEFEDTHFRKGADNSLEYAADRILGEGEEIIAASTKDKVEISMFNGTKYLIHKKSKGDECLYYFFSEEKNLTGINGIIKFKQTELDKANKVLSDFLSNVRF